MQTLKDIAARWLAYAPFYEVYASGKMVGTISGREYSEIVRKVRADREVWFDMILFEIGVAARCLGMFLWRAITLTVVLPVIFLVWASFADPSALMPHDVTVDGIAATVRLVVAIAGVFALVSLVVAPPTPRQSPYRAIVEGWIRRRFSVEEYKRLIVFPRWRESELSS